MLLPFSPEKKGNTFGSSRAAAASTSCKEDLRHCMVLDLSD